MNFLIYWNLCSSQNTMKKEDLPIKQKKITLSTGIACMQRWSLHLENIHIKTYKVNLLWLNVFYGDVVLPMFKPSLYFLIAHRLMYGLQIALKLFWVYMYISLNSRICIQLLGDRNDLFDLLVSSCLPFSKLASFYSCPKKKCNKNHKCNMTHKVPYGYREAKGMMPGLQYILTVQLVKQDTESYLTTI